MRSSARVILALPKPSTAAWVVDLLAREDPQVVDSLADLGESLREAQEDLDPGGAAHTRRPAPAARRPDRGPGRPAGRGARAARGPAIRDEIEQTLQAALADERAAEALRTGRLIRALETNGFDAVDLDGARRRRCERCTAGGGRDAARKTAPVEDLAAARSARRSWSSVGARSTRRSRWSGAEERVGRARSEAEAARHARDEQRAERDELQRRLDEVEERCRVHRLRCGPPPAAWTTRRTLWRRAGIRGPRPQPLHRLGEAPQRVPRRLSSAKRVPKPVE